jgi:hypothetical protein
MQAGGYSPKCVEVKFSEVHITAVLVEEGDRLRDEESTGIEEAVNAAATWLAQQLSHAQSTFAEELPLWLQLLLVAIIVVSVYQWQRRRR